MQRIPLRILFVDDSEIDVELTLRTLKQRGFDVSWERVAQEAGLRKVLAGPPPDVILSDFSMPCYDGAQALLVAREMAPDVPFVFLSGTIGEARAAEAIRLGAAGYVEKGNVEQLEAVLRRIRDANAI